MVNSKVKDQVKWCSVPLSAVVSRGKRLEASFFDVEAKQAFDLLNHGKFKAVNLISNDGPVESAYYGGRLKRHYVKKNNHNAIGFLGSSEMLDCMPIPIKYMLNDENAKDVRVEKNTILISRSGTIGNVTYVGKTLSKYLVSEHAIRIKCKDFPGYVYTFLKSHIGKTIVCSTKFGAVIQEIEPEHLASIPIPNVPKNIKERIHNLIVKSYALRDESNDYINQATQFLIKELHLPDINNFDVNDYKKNAPVETFTVKLSKLNSRADASYHVPLVDAIIEHLKKYAEEVTQIADERISSDVVLPGRFKRVFVEKEYGVKFLGGKEMHQLDPSTEKYLSRKVHKKQLEGTLGIKENSILTSARGSLGEVVLPPKHFINWAISDNLMQIISYGNICGYLFIFLNTDYGKALIQRYIYGGVIDAIEPEHIKKVEVPLLKNKAVQKQINDLALLANDKRYEAYKLEQEALSIMDKEVIYAK